MAEQKKSPVLKVALIRSTMPRTTEIIAEETAPVSSPLRRSSRIVAVSIPPTETSKPIRTRRSSATQENTEEDKVEAKPNRGRRAASMTKDEPSQKPEPSKTRTRRTSATPEPNEEPKSEPAKPKTRRSSITTEPKEDDVKRQSIGGRRSSASENPEVSKQTKGINAADKSTEEEPVKRPLRGRRSSTQEEKGQEEGTIARSTRSTRSASREASLEPEEKKPVTRGRRKSVDAQETETDDKKQVRTRRSSTDKMDGEPEVKVAKIIPAKPKRRVSITENAVNLAPIEEHEGERKSISPVLNQSAEISQLTPIKKKQESAKAELDLSIINETSFVEENYNKVESGTELPVCSNKEATPSQATEEIITTPKKSPRFRQNESATEHGPSPIPTEENKPKHDGSPTDTNKHKSPDSPRKSLRIVCIPADLSCPKLEEAMVQKTKEETENKATSLASPKKSPRIPRDLNSPRKIEEDTNRVKSPATLKKSLKILTDQNSLKSEEIPVSKTEEDTENIAVQAALTPRKSPRIQPEVVKSVSPGTKPHIETIKETVLSEEDTVQVGDNQSAVSHFVESQSSPKNKSNFEDDSVFTSETHVSGDTKKKESTYISTGSDDSFQIHLSDTRLQSTSQEEDTDDLNTSKTSNSSDKENMVMNVDDSINQSYTGKVNEKQTVMALMKSKDTETKFEQNLVLARVSNVFRPKNIDFSFVEPMEVDKTGIDLDSTNIDKTANESKLLASIPDESANDSFSLQLDVTKLESPNSSSKLPVLEDTRKPEILGESKEITPLNVSSGKLIQVNSVVVLDDSIVVVENVIDEDQSTICTAAEMSTVLEESETAPPESTKLALDESYNIGVSKKVDISQDYDFDLPSEDDNEEIDKTNFLDASMLKESEAIPKLTEADLKVTASDDTVSGELELVTKKEDRDDTRVKPGKVEPTVENIIEKVKENQIGGKLEDKVTVVEFTEDNDSSSKNGSLESTEDIQINKPHVIVPYSIDKSNLGKQYETSESNKNVEKNDLSILKINSKYDVTMEAHHEEILTVSSAESAKAISHNNEEESLKIVVSNVQAKIDQSTATIEKCIPDENSPQISKNTNKSTDSSLFIETRVDNTDAENNKNIETHIIEDDGMKEKEGTADDFEDMEKSFQDVVNEDDSIVVSDKTEQNVDVVESSKDTTSESDTSPKEKRKVSQLVDKATEQKGKITSSKKSKKKGNTTKHNVEEFESTKSFKKFKKSEVDPNEEPDNTREGTVTTDALKKCFSLFDFFKKSGKLDHDPASVTRKEKLRKSLKCEDSESKPKKNTKSPKQNEIQSEDNTENDLESESPRKKKSKSKKLELSNEENKTQSTQKRVSLEEFANSKLDEFISNKIAEMEDESGSTGPSSSGEDQSSESGDEESDNEDNVFLDTMAEEGEEDTPSDGSNDIIDEGESIHTISDRETDDDYDSNDSFICDNVAVDLLSGEEYDLGDIDHKKERKSRIINVEDIETDVITIEKKVEPVKPKKLSRIISMSSSSDEDSKENLIEELQTLEIGETEPSTTQLMSAQGPSRRRSSITIIENINVQDIKDSTLSNRIHNLVDNFCTTIPKKGDISMNLSLEYARKSSSEDSLDSEKQVISYEKAQKSPKAKKADKRASSSHDDESPSKRVRVSTSLENLNEDARKKPQERRLSQSLEELKTKKRKKKAKKVKKVESDSPSKPKRRSLSEGDLKTQTFSLMNQLITDVKNRPIRTIKPTTHKQDISDSWEIDIADVKPSTSIVTRREIEKFKKSKRHPKDFRNEMLYDSSRVRRVDTKELLKKKLAYY